MPTVASNVRMTMRGMDIPTDIRPPDEPKEDWQAAAKAVWWCTLQAAKVEGKEEQYVEGVDGYLWQGNLTRKIGWIWPGLSNTESARAARNLATILKQKRSIRMIASGGNKESHWFVPKEWGAIPEQPKETRPPRGRPKTDIPEYTVDDAAAAKLREYGTKQEKIWFAIGYLGLTTEQPALTAWMQLHGQLATRTHVRTVLRALRGARADELPPAYKDGLHAAKVAAGLEAEPVEQPAPTVEPAAPAETLDSMLDARETEKRGDRLARAQRVAHATAREYKKEHGIADTQERHEPAVSAPPERGPNSPQWIADRARMRAAAGLPEQPPQQSAKDYLAGKDNTIRELEERVRQLEYNNADLMARLQQLASAHHAMVDEIAKPLRRD